LPVLVRQPAAAAAVKPPDGKYRADLVALAGAFIAFSLTWIIYSLALALLLPAVAYATVMIALLAVVFADVGGGVGLNLIRQRRHKVPSLTKITASLGAVSVSCIAAFPRGGGRGTTLMRAVHAVLDDHALTALLDARPQISRRLPARTDSAVWYDSIGYRARGTWRRMSRQPGCNTPSAPRQS
jgi:hypothetical protein